MREYVVWRTLDGDVDWFVVEGGQYRRLTPDGARLLKSAAFPGLWLDSAALLAGDLARVLAVLAEGLASPDHAEFARRLEAAAR